MIYTYKHLAHSIENFHFEIIYFFEQLFQNELKTYDENVLLRHSFIDTVNASNERLKGNLIKITESYFNLSIKDKNTLKKAFKNNSDIAALCEDGRKQLVKYEAIEDKLFVKLLKDFLTMLWEDYPQNTLVENMFGTVKSHFDAFIDPNYQQAFVCPFCGLLSLKPKGLYRNAYDHFIPKAMYPFVSINFQNLFPICYDCNSDEKKSTDTLYLNPIKRRKALHPFDTTYNKDDLNISIHLNETYSKQNLKTLLQNINWNYVIKLDGKNDVRLNTWDEVFKIKRRYKEHLLQYEKSWFEDILMKKFKQDMQDGLTFNRFKEKLMDESRAQIQYPLGMLRYVYFNFLFSISDLENKLKAMI